MLSPYQSPEDDLFGDCFKLALSGNPVISVNGQLDVQQHKRREDRD